MRKTSMKSVFVALLLLLVFALAACTGGGNGDDTTTAPTTTAPITTQAPVTTAPPADGPAVKPVLGYTPDIADFTLTAIEGLEEYTIVYSELADESQVSESSADVRARVIAARGFAQNRMKGDRYLNNASLDSAGIRKYCRADDEAMDLLHIAYDLMGLSARGYDRIMRVARTIADLDKSDIIRAPHIAEAIQFRSLDRKYWGIEEQ